MPTTPEQDRRVYRFGLYEVDLEQGTLSRQGTPVKLQEQPFRVLSLLLEMPGEVLSREELRRRIWPQGTFVEFDGSLNTALMKLRAALNDNAENPIFIETVPRRGYRFIAPVEVAQLESTPVVTAIRIEGAEGHRRAFTVFSLAADATNGLGGAPAHTYRTSRPMGQIGHRWQSHLFRGARCDRMEPDADVGGRRKHPAHSDSF